MNTVHREIENHIFGSFHSVPLQNITGLCMIQLIRIVKSLTKLAKTERLDIHLQVHFC